MADSTRIDVDAIESRLADRAPSWPVAERFCSINGEGPRAGRLAAFIRFAGCNLACSYCDTAWANEAGVAVEHMDSDAIVDFVSQTGATCITLTGGEPLLQPDSDRLILALLAADPAWTVEIETNGACDLEPVLRARKRWAHWRVAELLGEDDGSFISRINRKNLFEREAGRVSITMDWKLPSSGMEGHMREGNLALLRRNDALKFVVGSRADLDAARALTEQNGLAERTQVLLSPVYGAIDPADIVAYMKENGCSKARLQLQLHKIIWPDREKGV